MVKGVQKSVVASPRECAINGLLAAAAVGYGAMDSFSAHRPVHCAHTIGKSSLVRSLVLGKIRAKATAGRRVARVQPGSRIGMISLLTMSLLAAGMLPAQNLKMNPFSSYLFLDFLHYFFKKSKNNTSLFKIRDTWSRMSQSTFLLFIQNTLLLFIHW